MAQSHLFKALRCVKCCFSLPQVARAARGRVHPEERDALQDPAEPAGVWLLSVGRWLEADGIPQPQRALHRPGGCGESPILTPHEILIRRPSWRFLFFLRCHTTSKSVPWNGVTPNSSLNISQPVECVLRFWQSALKRLSGFNVLSHPTEGWQERVERCSASSFPLQRSLLSQHAGWNLVLLDTFHGFKRTT